MRNTKHELRSQVSEQERAQFRCDIADSYFEDIVKGTYIKSEKVQDYFSNFGNKGVA